MRRGRKGGNSVEIAETKANGSSQWINSCVGRENEMGGSEEGEKEIMAMRKTRER